MKSTKISELLFLLIFVFVPLPAGTEKSGASFPSSSLLDPALSAFDRVSPGTALVIMRVASGEVVYVYNRVLALERHFPPGSIAKVWSAVVLLENREIFGFDPAHSVLCRGGFRPGPAAVFAADDARVFNLARGEGREMFFRCSLRHGHGEVDMARALSESCNVYFLTAACADPGKFFSLLVNTWRLHEKTGCRLVDVSEPVFEDIPGVTPFRRCAAAIGEGGVLRVSLMQVAVTFGALYARSALLSPFESPYYGRVEQYPLEISESTAALVMGSMSEALKSGTLKGLKVDNGEVTLIAGKTGTASHVNGKYRTHGWTVIYFRFRGETYVLVSFVTNGSGSGKACDASRTILEALH